MQNNLQQKCGAHLASHKIGAQLASHSYVSAKQRKSAKS